MIKRTFGRSISLLTILVVNDIFCCDIPVFSFLVILFLLFTSLYVSYVLLFIPFFML